MEAIVAIVIKKVSTALIEEALTAFSPILEKQAIHGSMRRTVEKLDVMRAFVADVDGWKNKDKKLETWLEQIRKEAFRLEDVVDEYSYLISQHRRSRLMGSIKNSFCQLKNLSSWRRLSAQLKEIEDNIQQLTQMKDQFNIRIETPSCIPERQIHRADSSYFFEDDDVVGIHEEKKKLQQWMKDEKLPLSIISIWGMGGLGKTTLVNNVYKSQDIKQYFDCRAWISISQTYMTDDILKRILKDILGRSQASLYDVSCMDHRDLVEALRSYLKEKRYLIILDDVWSTNAWYGIQGALPNNNRSSKIVITTRQKDVAFLAPQRHVLELRSLNKDEAWFLFCRKAFWNQENKKCLEMLEPWAEKIVDKCQGLPLAIVAIGGMLSTREMNEMEWRKVHDRLNWEFTDNPNMNVKDILNLSFFYLPDYLKSCFLYCSTFPEDYLLNKIRLTRLWIAEGFIHAREGNTVEEIAEEYFNELVCRSMLQIAKRDDSGIVISCRMHDLLRDLSMSISKTNKFSVALACDGREMGSLHDEARRLFLLKSGDDLRSISHLSNFRSVLVFDGAISPALLRSVVFQFRLLRVLDLHGCSIEKLPDEVVNLFNLHYLSLNNAKVKKLPKSIGKLGNLQTLDLYNTDVESLPPGVAKLKKLRHLLAGKDRDPSGLTLFHHESGIQVPKGMWNLKALQTLGFVEANAELVREMKNMTELRILLMVRVQSIHCTELCASITKMCSLTILSILASDEEQVLDFQSLNPPPPRLKSLALTGKLATGLQLPFWQALGSSLRMLFLFWSGFRDDPLPSLSHLSNLAALGLGRAYHGTELTFRTGWFPKLKRLFLANMEQLSMITIERGSMESLSSLNLIRLPSMRGGPVGLEFLHSLQEMNLQEMPREFARELQTEDNRSKVQHIPIISDFFIRDGELVEESLSR